VPEMLWNGLIADSLQTLMVNSIRPHEPLKAACVPVSKNSQDKFLTY
jgi:hypothetical protein